MAKTKKNVVLTVDTDPIIKRCCEALNATWQVIGFDALAAIGEEEATQEDVIDFVSSCGFATGYPGTYGNDIEAMRWMETLPYEEAEKILKMAFPYKRYS